MTDRDILEAMLDKAKILRSPERTAPGLDVDRQCLPDGAVSFTVGDYDIGHCKPQPYDGGYSGFFTEFVFSAEGDLLAVWGWE